MKRVHIQRFGPNYVMARMVRWHVPRMGAVDDAASNFETVADKRYSKRGMRSKRRLRRIATRTIFRLREKVMPKRPTE